MWSIPYLVCFLFASGLLLRCLLPLIVSPFLEFSPFLATLSLLAQQFTQSESFSLHLQLALQSSDTWWKQGSLTLWGQTSQLITSESLLSKTLYHRAVSQLFQAVTILLPLLPLLDFILHILRSAGAVLPCLRKLVLLHYWIAPLARTPSAHDPVSLVVASIVAWTTHFVTCYFCFLGTLGVSLLVFLLLAVSLVFTMQ